MLQGASYLWHAFVFHILFNETCKTATKYICMNLRRNLHNEKSDGKLLPNCQWGTSASHHQTQKEVFWTGYVLRLGFTPTSPQVLQVIQNEALSPLLSFSLSCHMHSTNAWAVVVWKWEVLSYIASAFLISKKTMNGRNSVEHKFGLTFGDKMNPLDSHLISSFWIASKKSSWSCGGCRSMKMNVFPLPFTSIIFLPFPYPSFIVCTGVTCLWATRCLLKPGVCYNTCIGTQQDNFGGYYCGLNSRAMCTRRIFQCLAQVKVELVEIQTFYQMTWNCHTLHPKPSWAG